MYKDDETRRVLYEVLLEQCFERMPEEEKAKWIRNSRTKGVANEKVNSNSAYHADDVIYDSLCYEKDKRSGQGRNITND